MILICNSCGKKFVVPDSAITASGRQVQCGSCGNKWKQFPTNEIIKTTNEIIKTKSVSREKRKFTKPEKIQLKPQNLKKTKKRSVVKKTREISLYSPEYLAKKHGIKLNNNEELKETSPKTKVSFGFYNSLLFFLVIIIILSRGLYFFQEFIVQKLPFTEFYIDYFFESIRNMFELWKNLISNY